MIARRRLVVLAATACVTSATIVALAPSGDATVVPASVSALAACTAPAWAEGSSYAVGAQVTYQSHTYQALVAHTATPGAGWTPTAAPSLWRDLGACQGAGTPPPAGNPTAGWTQAAFTFNVQKPWNLNVSDRYRYDAATGTYTCWVYDTDQPLSQGSATDPRTEMRWLQEYTTQQRMWDGDIYVASGTDGATVMQILRVANGAGKATDFMMQAYNRNGGTLALGSSTVLKTGVYNTWVNVKVAHNGATGVIQIYLNNQLVRTVNDSGAGATRHFKNGVYHHGTGRAEARFRNLHLWVR